MNTKRLTPVGKVVIFVLIAAIVLGGVYLLGGFNFLKEGSSSNVLEQLTSEKPSTEQKVKNSSNSGSSKTNTINISLDEWIGWKSIIDANGGLKTKPGSIYDKLGLNVNIHIINDATQSSNALIKGDLDGAGYTVNRYAFLYPKFKENNVEVLMPYITNFSTGGDGIISKDNIKGVEDLVGKKIAVPRFSEAQTLVWWLLEKSNLTEEQIKQIESDMVMFDTPDDAAKAFFSGQVDAAATWQPYLSQAQETTGAKLLFSTKSANSIILDGIVFNKKFYDTNKDVVVKFIQGTLDAKELYTTEFGPIKDTMPLFSTETDENIKAMTSDATLATYTDNVKLIGDTAKTLFVDMSNIWTRLGEKSLAEDVDKVFDTTALDTLKDKYSGEVVSTTPKVTDEQREKAKANTEALLKKSISINFQPNTAVFVDQEAATKALKEFVEIAKILDGAIIQIEGNVADVPPRNPESSNKLSLARAKTIAEALKYEGIDPSRFIIIGNGISNQIADNSTKEGQEKNRRTDIFFKTVE